MLVHWWVQIKNQTTTSLSTSIEDTFNKKTDPQTLHTIGQLYVQLKKIHDSCVNIHNNSVSSKGKHFINNNKL
jgi:hypothetical protein